MDVDEACHDIGYCGDENEFTLSPVLKTGLSTDYCDYCQTAVQYIEYAIDSDMTSDQIKVGLKKLCEKLGEQTMVETCDGFVDKYYREFKRNHSIIEMAWYSKMKVFGHWTMV